MTNCSLAVNEKSTSIISISVSSIPVYSVQISTMKFVSVISSLTFTIHKVIVHFVLGTDHLTCRGGVWGFFFVQNFFFGQHESSNFFLSRRARNLFPECNIRLYDKNSESDYFVFPPPKSEYFFQQHWESEYFFRKKPLPRSPLKLNGRSLISITFLALKI